MQIAELGGIRNFNVRINLESAPALESWAGSGGVLPAGKHGILLCGF